MDRKHHRYKQRRKKLVIGSPGLVSQKIEKQMLNFEAKSWCMLGQYRICPITEDNVLSQFHAALVAGLMARYKFDVT